MIPSRQKNKPSHKTYIKNDNDNDSSVSSSSEVATVLANPVSVVMLLSGGFYMSIQSLPPAARWVADLSLMKVQFGDCLAD